MWSQGGRSAGTGREGMGDGVGHHRREVRSQGERGGELSGVDLPGEAASDGEIGLHQTGVVAGHVFGEAVGPAA
ncbi:hypothetical protein GCM10010218_06570 [Streptomyces mashuensis]|uniref:Uncharacterized protein n=1 Tax=Streptomyces mashuensis TaxID=33904 RepID=A0A919E9N7_9ACTN|nr:hypothetical protein GCM10010218_06570 [Streptomyces mashuensis]